MTDEMMSLRALLEKSSDADLLREMVGFGAQRLMGRDEAGLRGGFQIFRVIGVCMTRRWRKGGFEPVWGFSCQAVVLGCADIFLFGAGKPFFVPSPAIRFAERAEGINLNPAVR